MSLEQETQHFEKALVKLAMPFWGKPRIASLLRAMVNRVQELENATWDVMAVGTIAGADTARLDLLGKIVGQPRFWADDETYRAVIRAKIRTNCSRGLMNDIVEVIQLAANDVGVSWTVLAPATLVVALASTVTTAEQIALEFLLPKARPVGVLLQFERPVSANHLTWASARTGGGGNFASAVSGGGDDAYSVRVL